MIEIVDATQAERRRQACTQRALAGLRRERTLSLGRYRITFTRNGVDNYC